MSGPHTDKAEQDYENREEESNVENLSDHISKTEISIHSKLLVDTKPKVFSLIYQKSNGETSVKPFSAPTFKDLYIRISKFLNDNCVYEDNILAIVPNYVPQLQHISEQTDYTEE